MCDCNAIEMKNLKGQVRSIDLAFRDAEATLPVVRHDLADTTKTLDYRDMYVKMSRANSDLRKSVADLEDTIHTLTEERDLARELFQGMVTKHAKLLDRYSMIRDYYDDLVSRYDALLPRNEAEHGEF